MKKYKHVKLGITAEWLSDHKMYATWISEKEKHYINRILVENSNDWEEVKEEGINVKKIMVEFDKKHVPHLMKEEHNYLITAFEGNKSDIKFQLQSNGRYKDSDIGAYFDKDFLLNNTTIFSIKNEFGKEFSIGDKVRGDNEEFTIESFQLRSHILGGCYACGTNKLGKVKVSIKLLNVVKSPIYTTTDGVKIFEGDYKTVYLISKEQPSDECKVCAVLTWSKEDCKVADRYLTFTSEENIDKYIKENTKKPVFVSADNVEFYDNNTDYSLFSVLPKANWQENRYRLNDIIKWPKKEWLHFHTKEARQEYIDNNKPKYSLADVFMASEKIPSGHLTTTGMLDQLKKLGK